MRDKARTEARKRSGGNPAFFGIAETDDAYRLFFTDDPRRIADQPDNMQLAIIAPDNEAFDMLQSKDMTGKLKLKDEATLRRYLLNLLDSV